MMNNARPMNLFTVDFEEWAESSIFLLPPAEAEQAKRRPAAQDQQIDRGVQALLDLLAEHKATATFFVLASTAQNHKQLAELILKSGHEIGSHSMSHTPLSELSREKIKYELDYSKKFLEDLLSTRVSGFRAPALKSCEDRAFFLRELAAAGYLYDSSRRADEVSAPGRLEGVVEFPVTVASFFGKRVPLGGTYLKLLGAKKVSSAIERENQGGRPAVTYIHPYEADACPAAWTHPHPSLRAKISIALRNAGKQRNQPILRHILERHDFVSARDYLASIKKRG